MHFNPWALIPLGVCIAVSLLVLNAQFKMDTVVLGALWGLFGIMSLVAVIKMIQGRHMNPYTQTDTMPRRIREWVLGESSKRPKSH